MGALCCQMGNAIGEALEPDRAGPYKGSTSSSTSPGRGQQPELPRSPLSMQSHQPSFHLPLLSRAKLINTPGFAGRQETQKE